MIIVDVMGGFGNQLFQICLALFFKKHGLNPKLYAFKDHDYDDHNFYIVNEKNFGLKTYSLTGEKLLKKIKNYKKIEERFFTVIKEDKINEIKNLDFKNNKLVTSFNGFWQDKYFVDEVYVEFYKGITKTKAVKNSLDLPVRNGSTMLHIRRGDHQDYLPIKYYTDSIASASSDIKDFSLDIFTDDKEWVLSQDEFKMADNVFGPSESFQSGKETVNTFSQMLNYENFIISNSTYSWWAARIGEKSNSIIYYPYPHWVGFQPDIYYDKWTKVIR